MIILGITGTLGAGKGTVVDYLVEKYHYNHFSVRKYLISRLNEEGKEPNRDNFTELANRLRSENSPSYLIEQLYILAKKSGENAIIESIRTVGEVEKLKSQNEFYLLAIDAEIQERYQRILQRNSETDHVSFEKFKFDEQREMTSHDPNKQNIEACIKLADYHIYNDMGLEDLHRQIDKILTEINTNA